MLNSIEEVIGALRGRLSEYLSQQGIEDPSKKFICLNKKVHNDSSPSMQLHKSGSFVKCFSCGSVGDLFTVASWIEDLPLSGDDWIKDNVLKLADRFGIKYSILPNSSEKILLKYSYFKAYAIVNNLLTEFAKNTPTEAFTKEITRRKWAEKRSIELGLGCIDTFKTIEDSLIVNGFTKETIDMLGLNRRDLFHHDNLIFGVYDSFGRPCSFYARDTKFEEKKLAYDNRDKMDLSSKKCPSKYNSTSNFPGIYEKSLNPYGIHDAKDFHKVILVEGHGCRHNLRLNGVDNVLALGGLSFNEALLKKLESLGVTTIVILLDNDAKGKERLRGIIKQFYGKVSIDFLVLDMGSVYPDVKDPDELIRKHKIEAFKEIPERNALEWLIEDEIIATEDPYTVIHEMAAYIALERSPINRLKIITWLAESTGIDKSAIVEEVDLKIAASKDRKGEFALKVLDEAREAISMNPNAVDAAVNLINNKLSNLNDRNDEDDLYGSNETLKALLRLNDEQVSGEVSPIIKTGFPEFDNNIELPTNEAFILMPAAPNCGKTSLFLCLAKGIIENNDDTLVLMFTNDDSRSVYFNRLVASDCNLPINWIKNPSYYLNDEMKERRRKSHKKISDFIIDNRLVIKDSTHGISVEYMGGLLKYYRTRFPNKKIVLFCDNFHKLSTDVGYDDKRMATEYISKIMKGFTNKYDCIIFATVELAKSGMHLKPDNSSAIKESGAMEYDANLILYLWNSLNSKRGEKPLTFDSSVMFFEKATGQYKHKAMKRPIIECLVLKNKLSEYKDTIYLKFFQDIVFFENMSKEEASALLTDE